MESTVSYERRRPSEPRAQLLLALLPLITIAGIGGSLCGLHVASALLYWPVAALLVGAFFAFRPRTA